MSLQISPPTEFPSWDELPDQGRQVMLRLLDRRIQRLRAEGVEVYMATAEAANQSEVP